MDGTYIITSLACFINHDCSHQAQPRFTMQLYLRLLNFSALQDGENRIHSQGPILVDLKSDLGYIRQDSLEEKKNEKNADYH